MQTPHSIFCTATSRVAKPSQGGTQAAGGVTAAQFGSPFAGTGCPTAPQTSLLTPLPPNPPRLDPAKEVWGSKGMGWELR